jgi:hypothetical protein
MLAQSGELFDANSPGRQKSAMIQVITESSSYDATYLHIATLSAAGSWL